MKPLRISVLLPRPTGFYRGLLPQMMSGFQAAGFEANGTCESLDEAGVLKWCREHQSDVVFDMNRTRSQLPELPRHVRHVTWIVDYLGRTDEQIKGSDITYFFTTGWVASFPHSSFVDWFPPGSCTDTYAPSGAAFESDAAVAGHVPPPWSESELSRNVSKTERLFSFGELVQQFQAWVQALRDDDEATHSSYWSAANRIVRAATGDDITDARSASTARRVGRRGPIWRPTTAASSSNRASSREPTNRRASTCTRAKACISARWTA
jgi:hypothetical protein